jgi:hypothetical protein
MFITFNFQHKIRGTSHYTIHFFIFIFLVLYFAIYILMSLNIFINFLIVFYLHNLKFFNMQISQSHPDILKQNLHFLLAFFQDKSTIHFCLLWIKKSKVIPRQAEVAVGVRGRLRPRIISTFGTTRVVGRQPNVPAAFTPEEIPGTHFQRLSRPQGPWFCRKEPRKKSHRESIPGPSD